MANIKVNKNYIRYQMKEKGISHSDLAKLLGCILPMLAKKVKLDPAIMAAPLITTIVDTCSVLIYFSIAVVIMNV